MTSPSPGRLAGPVLSLQLHPRVALRVGLGNHALEGCPGGGLADADASTQEDLTLADAETAEATTRASALIPLDPPHAIADRRPLQRRDRRMGSGQPAGIIPRREVGTVARAGPRSA